MPLHSGNVVYFVTHFSNAVWKNDCSFFKLVHFNIFVFEHAWSLTKMQKYSNNETLFTTADNFYRKS